MGNQKANRYWERRLPSGFVRPTEGHQLKTFIRNKYMDKMYVPMDMPPPDIQNYQSHPYCMDEKTAVAEEVSPPKKNKSAPQLYPRIEPAIPTVETARKTPLMVETVDFILLGDDVQSNQSAPQSMGTGDWEPFKDSSPAKGQSEKSGSSWNAFENSVSTKVAVAVREDLSRQDRPVAAAAAPDPFGLDALPQTPPAETTSRSTFGTSAPVETPSTGQQTTEDILKLYDAPRKMNEPLLPPNLGLPMGPPPGVHSMYPGLHGSRAPQPFPGFAPQMVNGHMYPQIAVPNAQPSFMPGGYYAQGSAYFNASGKYPPHSFYGQHGPK